MLKNISDKLRHFFHVVSNVRPIVWICLYIVLTPIFALIYHWLPDSQFRIPDGAPTDYGSWLYYSIVTITTLGFGDYTPAHGWAQAVTAVEVMCGLIILGLFLNAVGSMKSEIDVESEIEKQKRLHEAAEKEKLVKSTPSILHNLNIFLSHCYAVTTPYSKREKSGGGQYNPSFTLKDMADLYKPSGLPTDHDGVSALDGLLRCSSRISLYIDSLQNRVDLTLWPDLLEDCFAFVANYQMLSAAYSLSTGKNSGDIISDDKEISEILSDIDASTDKSSSKMHAVKELYHFIKENGDLAIKIEAALTKIAS